MRRFVTFLLAAVMLFSLCACSSAAAPDPKASSEFPYRKGSLNILATVNRDYTMIYDEPNGTTQGTVLHKGDQAAILSISEEWARTNKGWLLLEYLDYNADSIPETTENQDEQVNATVEPTVPTTTPSTNTIPASFSNPLDAFISGDNLRVRNNPGTTATKIDSLDTGHFVTILGISYVDNVLWAYIKYAQSYGSYTGWVSMEFVKLRDYNLIGGFPVHFVNSTTLYATPGYGNSSFGTVPSGSTVNIWCMRTANNAMWGFTDNGWVDLTYATLPGNIQLVEGYTT